MNWKFKVCVKCIYDNEFINRWKYFEYDATELTWYEAWHKCITEAINSLESNEVIFCIESENVIARVNK